MARLLHPDCKSTHGHSIMDTNAYFTQTDLGHQDVRLQCLKLDRLHYLVEKIPDIILETIKLLVQDRECKMFYHCHRR